MDSLERLHLFRRE